MDNQKLRFTGLFLIIAFFLILVSVGKNFAQEANSNADTSEKAQKKDDKPVSPEQKFIDELVKIRGIEYADKLAEFLTLYPYNAWADSLIASLTDIKGVKTAAEAKTFKNRLLERYANINPVLKALTFQRSGMLFVRRKFYAEAIEVLQNAKGLVSKEEFVEYKKKSHSETMASLLKEDPAYKPYPFDLSRAEYDYTYYLQTGVINNLATAYWESGNSAEAEKYYRESLGINLTKESALGLARSLEKKGDLKEALKYATMAALTGSMKPSEMEYFYKLYAQQNGGKTEGAEAYLDAEYLKTYKNPIEGGKYKKSSKRSDRTVLAEFVTGAGCIPCIPFDYAFEKVLDNYSRKEVVLLSYHVHAPTMDPIGNHSSEARSDYYKLNGAPAIFLDGKGFEEKEDLESGERSETRIRNTYDSLVKSINPLLDMPSEASLKLKTGLKNRQVSVKVSADKFKNASDDVTLHIALAENEISYSGENGLRFHFMAVRALAGDNDKKAFGFKMDSGKSNKIEYVFDLAKIEAQNLKYYDETEKDMRKRILGDMGDEIPEGFSIDFSFNYKRNLMNDKHLAVVAFLQDNKTKKVLQTTFVSLKK